MVILARQLGQRKRTGAVGFSIFFLWGHPRRTYDSQLFPTNGCRRKPMRPKYLNSQAFRLYVVFKDTTVYPTNQIILARDDSSCCRKFPKSGEKDSVCRYFDGAHGIGSDDKWKEIRCPAAAARVIQQRLRSGRPLTAFLGAAAWPCIVHNRLMPAAPFQRGENRTG